MKRLLVVIFCLFASVAWADRKVIVTLKTPTDTGSARIAQIRSAQRGAVRALAGTTFTIHRTYTQLPLIAVEVDDAGLTRLHASPDVEAVTEDGQFFVPPEPPRSFLRGLLPQLTQALPVVGADKAHAQGIDGKGWSVAIVDTGLELSHPAFANRIIGEGCFVHDGQCPDGTNSMQGPGAGASCIGSSSCFHGTHVAGIAAGQSGAVTGIAKGAGIVAVNVFTVSAGGGASAFFSDIIAAHEWLATQTNLKIASINMSLGTNARQENPCDSVASFIPVKAAIDLALAANIGVVAASGNGSSQNGVASPGCLSNVIATGCSDNNDGICSFSNEGPAMEIRAPGLNILSANLGGGTRRASGTSMSTPFVAGAHALVRQTFPTIGPPASIRTLLKFQGTDVQGRPRLWVGDLTGSQPPDPNDPIPPDPNQPQCPDCPPSCADADGDGEVDATDRCPNTPPGEAVDDAGCSRAQWCRTITPATWRTRGDCRALDFLNDEPRNAKDCKVIRRGFFDPRPSECVPR